MRPRLRAMITLMFATAGQLALARAPGGAEDWPTRAESSGFRATSSYDETLDFLRRLAPHLPEMKLEFFGRSAEGRPLPVVIVSGSRRFTPESAAADGRPVIWIQSGIHGGEIDGKDATLMILRDLAQGRHRRLLERLVLVLVPIYNVDGHERVSPFNRPNQDGPVDGMGFRTTADGHDLNRDHVKLETPEARALVRLFRRWRPDLHIDNHVTDGADHDWVLTYSWVEAPQLAPSLDAWLVAHMPRAIAATERAGHRLGPYVDLIDPADPSRGFSSYVGQPRYATGYFPLRHCPSILIETHSYKPFRQRVLANRDFLLALLDEAAQDPRALVEAVRAAGRRTVALGAGDAAPSEVVLNWTQEATGEPRRFPVYDWSSEPSVVLGGPLLRYRTGSVREIEVPWIHRPVAAATVARPRGYLVLPGWPVIAQRLADHGLRVRRLDRELELELETLRLREAGPREPAVGTYQGRTRPALAVERRLERRRVPAGTLWVAADQPDFEVAVQLLEPEAADSLVAWGLLSIVLERKEYIASRVLEPLAAKLLADPAIAAEWERALRDESFAGDPGARREWWYRRTPYWDERVGLLPVFRLLTATELPTSPWTGPAEPGGAAGGRLR